MQVAGDPSAEECSDKAEGNGDEAAAVRVAGDSLRHAAADAGDEQEQYKDRKSTRLNSSHEWISYAVFCLKKKRKRSNGCEADTRRAPDTHPYKRLLPTCCCWR